MLAGSLKRYFSILQREKRVLIFTYNDSDEFLPVFSHSFEMKDIAFAEWSPLASSLLCFKEKELIVLPIDPSIEEIKFPVDGELCAAKLSPQERFLCLMHISSHDPQLIKLDIREVKTGLIRKTFGTGTFRQSYRIGPINFLKWDKDDCYFAVVDGNRAVNIYETQRFSCVNQPRFKKVRNFSWSPSTSAILALFGDAYVKVVDISSGKVFFRRAWDGVDDCQILWQSDGDYFACICMNDEYQKIFLLSLKSQKAEFITPRQDYIDFAWKRNGKEFAVTRGTNDGPTEVIFYTINDDAKHLRQRLKVVNGLKANYLYWSPNGRYMVMQGPRNGPGELYFYDVENHQQLALVYFIAFDLQWDSGSRFFLTRATAKNCLHQVVRIWSSHGEKLIDVGPLDLAMCWSNKVSCVGGSSLVNVLTKESSCENDGEHVLGKRPMDSSAEPKKLQKTI